MKPSAPYLVSGLLAASSLVSAAALMLNPEPFSPGSALLIAAGLLLYTLIALAGILLVRAPWARSLGAGTAVAATVLAAVTGFDTVGTTTSMVIALLALGGLAGPWLTVWLRQRPGTGPEPAAIALPLVAVGSVPIAGLAAWQGLTVPVMATALVGIIAGAAYARADRWGLWALRAGYPILTLVAAIGLGTAGALVLTTHGVIVAILAWLPSASRAQRPIGAELPAPRYRRSTP